MIALYTFDSATSTQDAANFCARHQFSREELVSVLQTQSSGSVDGMPYEAVVITLVLDCTPERLRAINEAEGALVRQKEEAERQKEEAERRAQQSKALGISPENEAGWRDDLPF